MTALNILITVFDKTQSDTFQIVRIKSKTHKTKDKQREFAKNDII